MRSWARILKLAQSLSLNSNVTLKVNSFELVVDSSGDLEVRKTLNFSEGFVVKFHSLTYRSSCCRLSCACSKLCSTRWLRRATEISRCCRPTRALLRRERNLSTCRERKQSERKKETRAEWNCMCNMTLKLLPAWVDCPFLCQHSDNTMLSVDHTHKVDKNFAMFQFFLFYGRWTFFSSLLLLKNYHLKFHWLIKRSW